MEDVSVRPAALLGPGENVQGLGNECQNVETSR